MNTDDDSLNRKIAANRAEAEELYEGAVETIASLMEEMNSAGYGIRRVQALTIEITHRPKERWAFLRRLFGSPVVCIRARGPNELEVFTRSVNGKCPVIRGSLSEITSYLAAHYAAV